MHLFLHKLCDHGLPELRAGPVEILLTTVGKHCNQT